MLGTAVVVYIPLMSLFSGLMFIVSCVREVGILGIPLVLHCVLVLATDCVALLPSNTMPISRAKMFHQQTPVRQKELDSQVSTFSLRK